MWSNFTVEPNFTITNYTSNLTANQRMPGVSCGGLFDFIVMGVLVGALCLLGCVGNVLSMICLTKDKSKTATPFLLVSLEIADTLFLVSVLSLRVFTSFAVYFRWYLYPGVPLMLSILGVYLYPVSLIAETGSIWITVLVTVNRYVSVCRPYEVSSWCTVPQAKKQVIIIWILAVSLHMPRFFEHTIYYENQNSEVKVRLTEMAQNDVYKILYGSILYCIIMFLVPLVTLILLNYRLIVGLQQTKRRRAQLLKSKGTSSSKSEEDITLTLIVVVLVFVITQLPALFTQIIRAIFPDHDRCPYFYFYLARLSDSLVVLNSSINFVIYCFCSRKFRKILESSITCKPSSNFTAINEQSQNDHTMQTYVDVRKNNGT